MKEGNQHKDRKNRENKENGKGMKSREKKKQAKRLENLGKAESQHRSWKSISKQGNQPKEINS